MDRKKVIGVSGSMMRDQGGPFPGYPRAYINHDYMRTVADMGAMPLMLPCLFDQSEETQRAYAKQAVEHIDALILSGGHDLFPPLLGQSCRQKLGATWPERDHYDLLLFHEAMEQQKPVLGICRGFQLICAHFGAELLQDLSYADHELLKHEQGHTTTLKTHEVTFERGTAFYEVYGPKTMVNSFHHQAVTEVKAPLRICAKASDGVIEAVMHESLPVYGVQWHPEMLSGVCEETKRMFQTLLLKD